VDCQLAYICGCIPARIQHALADLPETLDETYERTLREINKADWEFAHRLFQFVAVASRPLRVEELAELLAFDFKAGPIPKFHEDWRLEDPVYAVLSACSSLLAVVDVNRFPVIQFSHFSVKEFLTSARLAEASDIIHRRYHVSMTPAHTLASQACLGTLLHLDKDVITRESLKDYPLAKYAAKHWVYHAQFEEVSQSVEDGMKQLFDPSKPHLTVCIWIHNPEPFWLKRNDRDERPSPTLRSPLHYAAFWGLHSIVHFLVIELSQDVHSRSVTHDATPLHVASENGHKQVALFLLERGADVSAQEKYGKTPLHLASLWGHVEVAYLLIERGADVSAQDKAGETPLHLASRWGRVEVAHMLMERGANGSAQDKAGETPLHVASRWGRVEAAHMLIERGADVSAQDGDGNTPLHLASQEGHMDVAHMLIEHGADISAQDKDGETPLHLASLRGHVKVAHMVIERRADVSAQNKYGKTPLHLASRRGHMDVAHMLIERGADVSAQDGDGNTPLHLASLRGHVEVVHMLIERGADVSAQDKYGNTLLHLALRWGHVEVAHMLIERGADFSTQDGDGNTPLHLALRWGHVEVAHKLIEHGADATARNKDRKTPLHLASNRDHTSAIGGSCLHTSRTWRKCNKQPRTTLG
jgi:ankyrin repeat protein